MYAMIVVMFAFGLSLGVVNPGPVEARPTGSEQDQKVVLFTDCSYRGDSYALGPGEYGDRDLGIGNDALSSIQVPPGMRVTLYTDNRQSGESRVLTRDVRCLESDWNDEVSSMLVEWVGYDDIITVYDECNYRGANHTLEIGKYGDRDLGIGNDRISSILVPRGFEVILYTDNRQRGKSMTIRSDTRCLPSGFNNNVSSMEVRRRNR